MKKDLYLSVVIPCYNEEKNLSRGTLEEVNDYLIEQPYKSEVIICDDESTDEGVEIIKKFVKNHPIFRLYQNKHAGKPFALRLGLNKARGEIVLFTDMDQSTPISELDKLLPYFAKNEYEVVIGSRGTFRKSASFLRKVMSKIFLNFRRLIILPEIIDTQCGFKAFKRDAIKKIFPQLAIFKIGKKAQGWTVTAYDVEALFLAKKMGLKIKEVPVNWQDKDISVGKEQNFVKESKEMLVQIWQVKFNDWRGKYG